MSADKAQDGYILYFICCAQISLKSQFSVHTHQQKEFNLKKYTMNDRKSWTDLLYGLCWQRAWCRCPLTVPIFDVSHNNIQITAKLVLNALDKVGKYTEILL